MVTTASLLYWCAFLPAGCVQVGPDYQPPETELPSQWSTATENDRQAESAAADLASWWTVFNDPILNSLISRALEDNHDLRIATARIRQTRAQQRKASSGLGPRLNSSGWYQRSQSSTLSPDTTASVAGPEQQATGSEPIPTDVQEGTVIRDQYRVGFDASWEVDIVGGVRRTVEAADAELQSAIEARRNVHITLIAEVAKEYIDLRSLQLRRNIAGKNLKAQQYSAELTEKRFDSGFAGGLDVAYAQSQTAVTASEIPMLEAAARQKIYSLSILVGQPPAALVDELVPVKEIPTAGFSHIVPAGVPSDLLRRRPDIRRAEQKIHAATALIGVAEADLFPKFYITGATAYQSESVNSLFDPVSWLWSFGPGFSWNLFSSGQVRANIAQKEALAEQNILEYQQTVIKAMQEVESVFTALTKEKEHFLALANAVTANRKSVQLATTLYKEGEIDFIEVLIAQRALFQSEDALARSRSQLSTNLVALYKAVGGGWDANAE
jgi:NodT family efflux transporter outer membrane factor (OMF) lipoprotein